MHGDKTASEGEIGMTAASEEYVELNCSPNNARSPAAGDQLCIPGEGKREAAISALHKSADIDCQHYLWLCIITFEGEIFTTSGCGSMPGVKFSYSISRHAGSGGRRCHGESVDDYGNELWVTTWLPDGTKKKLKKSISRSTVNLAYQRAAELDGAVKGPKALCIPGTGSYLYPMLIRFEVIKQGEA